MENDPKYHIRNVQASEFDEVGEILVKAYASLEGFPREADIPEYYQLLRSVGRLTQNENIELLVAVSEEGKVFGAVVFYHNMQDYGTKGKATQEQNACGFRLLGVAPETRGLGLGKALTEYCIQKGKAAHFQTLVIHSTQFMKLAWGMYERLGFQRAEDLDFIEASVKVFGFRLDLRENNS